ncbi:MAG: alpha/beta fold hydrolase [Vicinamibacterales bacterium]|jgi:pimeloyl-ACP methyl ester carboxylesterase|nr:alpha/beta fold hydrolase [Vicinamibacterales bacterium]
MQSRYAACAVLTTLLVTAAQPSPIEAQSRHVMIERFVPHTSTVPANAGERVGIYVREKATASAAARFESGASPEGRVVLFVHGGSVSSIPDYDLDYKDYSWMGFLAEAGFDTFAMDQSGYGRSPRPMMDDPCNMSRDDQALVTPRPLSGPCDPSYPYGSTTVQSDWDEIDTVVDYIRELRGVDRVSLVGWSAGGRRSGGYAARHPEKVDKLFLYAPGYSPSGPSEAPAGLPQPGVPMRLQTHETLTQGRWQENVVCENQVDSGIRDVIWRTIMAFDPLGSVWGPPEGVMRVRAGNQSWGWNKEYAAKVTAPTMIVVGEQDNPEARGVLHADLTGTDSKVLVTMGCATHFAVWETSQYKFMHRASLEWLTDGTYRSERNGVYRVGVDGAPPSGE